MKVKIIKSNSPSYWYSDRIGETFGVIDFNSIYYETINYPSYFILKEDAEVIEEDCIWYNLKDKEPKEGDKIIGIYDGEIIRSGTVKSSPSTKMISAFFYLDTMGVETNYDLPPMWTYFPEVEKSSSEVKKLEYKKIEIIDRRDYDTQYLTDKINELVMVVNKLIDKENK